jgi:hypothetical protein
MPKAKLTIAQVIEIRRLRGEGISAKELATRYGMSQVMIFKILAGTRWKSVPFATNCKDEV